MSGAWSRRAKSWAPVTRNAGAATERISSWVHPRPRRADEVLVADHEERGGGNRADLVVGPPAPIVDDRLHPLQERDEVVGVGGDRLVGGSPGRELLLGGKTRIVLLRSRDLGVVAIGPD